MQGPDDGLLILISEKINGKNEKGVGSTSFPLSHLPFSELERIDFRVKRDIRKQCKAATRMRGTLQSSKTSRQDGDYGRPFRSPLIHVAS